MLQLHNVSKEYANGHQALRQVSFQLEKGEMAFLTGHSGAGKSTLLKLIALIDRCSEGDIILQGNNFKRIARRKIPLVRRNMGVIFQDPYLLAERNNFHNVALPLIVAGKSARSCQQQVMAVLEQVGLANKSNDYPLNLSAGEQQRLSIARAIVSNPTLLLADEPTGNLDPGLAVEIMRLFEQLNQAGMTVLIASHDLALIARLKHRVITLTKGRLVSDGKN